jgi:hypothetical protein
MNVPKVKVLLGHLATHPARLEILVAEMMADGLLKLDEIEFRAVSTFARNYSHDIATAEIIDYPEGSVLRLSTHREGLYDQLPYALFNRPEPYHPGQKLNDRIKETEAAREREAVARSFFHPFEQAFFRTAIKSELTERRLEDGFNSPLRRRLLLSLWSHCTRVPAQSLPLLSYILPLSYRIAGDLALMTVSYRAVLRLPVTMKYIPPHTDAAHPAAEVITAGRLGQDLTLGGSPKCDLPVLEISIGPLNRKESRNFLPGGAASVLLELLNDCLVPYEVDVCPVFVFHQEAEALVLGSDTAEGSRLGFTSRIPELA